MVEKEFNSTIGLNFKNMNNKMVAIVKKWQEEVREEEEDSTGQEFATGDNLMIVLDTWINHLDAIDTAAQEKAQRDSIRQANTT